VAEGWPTWSSSRPRPAVAAGQPASLPANWSVTAGYLFGPTANLYSANRAGVNLGNADLEQAYLNDATLTNANLSAAYMEYAVLDGVNLAGCEPGWL
jgi:hypothetical protein